MAKRKRNKATYPNTAIQRNSCKWRVAGVAGNLKAIKKEHELVLSPDEVNVLAKAENKIRKLLDRWSS